ncbi:Sua5/YciO/YrdC/YwlC family protein [Candidatus Woesearchaeota archaeon]|jgi:L-threonylcarbamoyladenylate synthase|nr:Sua5/YciO/YrdC/YwlC family protein [Candidatus Woesearchaeota archaeon]
MKLIGKTEFDVNKQEYLDKIRAGSVFIYPTDTIYGIGCDATNAKAVQKIREIKERPDTPFSIIAPRKLWIQENCEVFGKGRDYVNKLPGKFTLIFALKHEDCVANNVNPNDNQTLGVRIPNHWISEIAKELNKPIITTSVNRSGESFLTDISKLPIGIRNKVDFAINEGIIKGNPSQVVDLVSGEAEIKR